MQYIELVKQVDGQELVVAGILDKADIQALQAEGYHIRIYNRHGILVA